MKKFLLITVLLFATNLFATQNKTNFGFNWGVQWPIGHIADNQDYGFSAGLLVDIPVSSKPYSLVTGLSWNFLDSKQFIRTDEYGYEEFYYSDSWSMISVSLGTKYLIKYGSYFLPSVAVNNSDGDIRIGTEIGTGLLLPVKPLKFKFDISAKYRLANLLLKEKNEKTVQMFSLTLGIVF